MHARLKERESLGLGTPIEPKERDVFSADQCMAADEDDADDEDEDDDNDASADAA